MRCNTQALQKKRTARKYAADIMSRPSQETCRKIEEKLNNSKSYEKTLKQKETEREE